MHRKSQEQTWWFCPCTIPEVWSFTVACLMVFTAGKWWCMSLLVKTCWVINKWYFGKQSMALMGMHYFHGAPQIGPSQGSRLIELDEWTVTWTKQVDPPLPHPDTCWLKLTHTHSYGHTHRPMHIHLILKGECVQLQGETWQRRDQLSSRQMTVDVGGLIISPALVWTPAAVCCWQLQPSVYAAVCFRETLTSTLS